MKSKKEPEWMKADHIQICKVLGQICNISFRSPVNVLLNGWITLSFSLRDVTKHPRQPLRPFHILLILPHETAFSDSFQDLSWKRAKAPTRGFSDFQHHVK